MKKLMVMLLLISLITSMIPLTVQAKETSNNLLTTSVEVLDNGDYIVTMLYENPIQARTGKTGYKVKEYHNTAGALIWDLTVTGNFTYTYGVSSKASSATADVCIYDSSAVFQRKNSWVSGSTATATGAVLYHSSVSNLSVSISCDKYGNLS